MKKILYWILLITGPIYLYSQSNNTPPIFSLPVDTDGVVRQMPEYPGGSAAFLKLVQTKLDYPNDAKERGIQGRVIVSFDIDEKGNVDSIVIKRKVWPSMDLEVMRLIRLTNGKWKPGTQQGKPVKVRFVMPIVMKLGDILMPISNPPGVSYKNEKKGVKAYNSGNYAAALKLFKAVHDADPSNILATHNLGLCLYQMGNYSGACSMWHSVRDHNVYISDLLIDYYCKSAK